eukprot:3898199-Ditylum_brightwellii.AAC.1
MDCFSRLPRMERPSEGKNANNMKGKLVAFLDLNVPPLEYEIYSYVDLFITPPDEKETQQE